jgi:branched-chain amino acid transport system substrate-binding protein
VAASGDPVKIGYVNTEGGAKVSLPEFRVGAQAAVAYSNAELGGIAGRPIELVRCDTDGTPESSQSCANQMVDQKVPLVVLGTDSQASTIAETITGAGIVYVTAGGNTLKEQTLPNSFVFNAGTTSALVSYAAFAKEKGFKSFRLLAIDVPSVTGPLKDYATPAFQKAGVDFQVIPIPPGTPDVSPQLGAALGSNPSALGVIGDGGLCTAYNSAYASLGATVPTIGFGACISPAVLKGAPDSVVEKYFVPAKNRLDDTGDEGQLYKRVITQYGEKGAVAAAANVAAGYSGIVGLVRLLHGFTGDITSANLAAALSKASAPYPMAPGVTLKCDGSAIKALPRVCSSNEFYYQLQPDKTLKFLEAVDVSSLLN